MLVQRLMINACFIVMAMTAMSAVSTALGQPPQQTLETPADGAIFPGAGIVNPSPPFLVGVGVNHADGRYQPEDELSMLVRSEQDAHVYLLYHQADGTSRLLLPNSVNRQSRIPAMKPAVVPPPNDPGYRFVMRAPFGQEVLQVIASQVPLPILEELVTPESRATAIEPQRMAALEKLLTNDLSTWSESHIQVVVDPPATPRKAARIGLFIGIGEYQDPKICPTHVELGHSAEVMHELMLRHGQLDPERTRLVMNEEATRANLEELFTRWLPTVSEPGDFVFIYFSGHSGTYETTDRLEPDGRDESICPYDVNAGDEDLPAAERLRLSRASDILDDTLGMWIQHLAGRQVVFVADTCHAGGLVQGKAAAAQLMPVLGDEAMRIKDISGMNLLVLSCCGPDEQAQFEGTSNQTMWFTMCLADTIERTSKRPLSAQDAFAAAAARMKEVLREANAGRMQIPQMFDSALLPVTLLP